jgi:hypothetical protein
MGTVSQHHSSKFCISIPPSYQSHTDSNFSPSQRECVS